MKSCIEGLFFEAIAEGSQDILAYSCIYDNWKFSKKGLLQLKSKHKNKVWLISKPVVVKYKNLKHSNFYTEGGMYS